MTSMPTKKVVWPLCTIVLVWFAAYCLESWIVLEPVYKRAVHLNQTVNQESRYIVCKYVRVTGFDWFAMENEKDELVEAYVRISGQDPLKEGLSYELLHGSNKFVLHYDERNEYYDDVMKETIIEYDISDWDILYPVKRDSTLFKPKGHIVMSDLE